MHLVSPLRASGLTLLLSGLLCGAPALAQGSFNATYATYSHLLNVLNIEASMDLTPEGYGIRVVTHTAGTVRLFLRSDIDTSVSGTFAAGVPRPVRYDSHGQMGGEPRITLIEYRGGQPVLRTLTPPNAADDRDEIAAADTAGTVDTLSAMAMLIRQVTATGRCEGGLTTYDGRRLATLTARTVGQETLEPTSRSTFAGPALRCAFEGRQTGGFKHDDDRAREQRPQHGTAWFARVAPGGPAVPVRVDFESRILGTATMYISNPLGLPAR